MNSRNIGYDSRNRSRVESQIRNALFHLLKLDRHLWKCNLKKIVPRNPHMDDLDYQGTFAIMYYYRCAFPGGHTHANVLVDTGSDYSIHDCFDGVLPQSSYHCCHTRYVTCNVCIIIVFEFYLSRCQSSCAFAGTTLRQQLSNDNAHNDLECVLSTRSHSKRCRKYQSWTRILYEFVDNVLLHRDARRGLAYSSHVYIGRFVHAIPSSDTLQKLEQFRSIYVMYRQSN